MAQSGNTPIIHYSMHEFCKHNIVQKFLYMLVQDRKNLIILEVRHLVTSERRDKYDYGNTLFLSLCGSCMVCLLSDNS